MKPPIEPDGRCSACRGGNQCDWHKAEGVRIDKAKWIRVRACVAVARQYEIGRICARHEIESDEGGTAYEKAALML